MIAFGDFATSVSCWWC